MRISGWVVAAAWLATFLLSYAALGGYLGSLVEGTDAALLSRGPLAANAFGGIACLALTFLWARGLRRRGAAPGESPLATGRRRFLVGAASALGGVVGIVGAGIARNLGWVTVTGPNINTPAPRKDPNPRAEWQGAQVRAYRRLGRTDFQVSDISLGSGRIRPERGGEEIARAAIERGINYFDTSPDYSNTGSETALGRALRGDRDRMFVATKFCTPRGHLPAGSSVEQYMEMVNGSLERLQTDYVDLVHVHACDSLDRLMDPNAHEAFDRLKEQGKARFLGVSTHTPNLEQVANTAISSGRFDVMMLAYHHGAWPQLGEIIERAHQSDVGVVAMKTLKGAKHRGLLWSRDEADSYSQAAFKWVLNNPSVSCLVISFFEYQHIDEYLFASGQRPASSDYALLDRYDQLTAGTHCRPHCGACLDSCPERLPIDDVLRYRMYFEDYGDEKEAMRQYAELRRGAEVCVGCSAPCVSSCPHGVPIQERMIGAHELLTLA